MALALSLGRRGLGRVWPNPSVGCVIVNDGRIVGRGTTADGGRPHAETIALAEAGAAARGATAYVSLEPCAHHGQTPPCATALVAAGIARVVIATGDPDPRVAGRGIAMLRAAGIEVTENVRQAEALRDNAGFFRRVRDNRPHVTLKLALTLDGRIATAAGESRWITGPEARRTVHAMRARHDAVLVGAGTVRSDDPSLTVRDIGVSRQPVRVVVSSDLNLPPGGALMRDQGHAPTWICHAGAAEASRASLIAQGIELIACGAGPQVDLTLAMAALAQKGLTRVFCEGGGTLAAGLMGAGLVDELVVFAAGKVIGADGRAGVGVLGLAALVDAPAFTLAEARAVGGDLMSRWLRA